MRRYPHYLVRIFAVGCVVALTGLVLLLAGWALGEQSLQLIGSGALALGTVSAVFPLLRAEDLDERT